MPIFPDHFDDPSGVLIAELDGALHVGVVPGLVDTALGFVPTIPS